jgi:hypothetical protein
MLDWLKRLFRRTTPAQRAAEELAARKSNEERLQRDLGRIIEKVNAKPSARPADKATDKGVRVVHVVTKTKGR